MTLCYGTVRRHMLLLFPCRIDHYVYLQEKKDDFQIDLDDDRFKSVFDSRHFHIDQSDPKFMFGIVHHHHQSPGGVIVMACDSHRLSSLPFLSVFILIVVIQ